MIYKIRTHYESINRRFLTFRSAIKYASGIDCEGYLHIYRFGKSYAEARCHDTRYAGLTKLFLKLPARLMQKHMNEFFHRKFWFSGEATAEYLNRISDER